MPHKTRPNTEHQAEVAGCEVAKIHGFVDSLKSGYQFYGYGEPPVQISTCSSFRDIGRKNREYLYLKLQGPNF